MLVINFILPYIKALEQSELIFFKAFRALNLREVYYHFFSLNITIIGFKPEAH